MDNQQREEQQDQRQKYPLDPSEYRLVREIGQGMSATVYEAKCIPLEETVAIKSIDLERARGNLEDIRREAQTMSLMDHPNVLRAHCSFIVDHSLWVVMPFMAAGSCQSIMKACFPEGLEEGVIGIVLKETLKALHYLHQQGNIHRDVKAGNILIDARGAVKVADFGVSACVFEAGDCDRHKKRNTFVGTPCWMAPEVIDPSHAVTHGNGYDHKADIWSFGITALELAHGHAPFSKLPPMKALLMQLQGAPPALDSASASHKKFSRAFREMVGLCLVKDPARRPSADKLLKHSFFRHTKYPDYLVKHLLHNLPSLIDRVRMLNTHHPLPDDDDDDDDDGGPVGIPHMRRISGWNFNEENLKFEPMYPSLEDTTMTTLRDCDKENRNRKKNQNPSFEGIDFEATKANNSENTNHSSPGKADNVGRHYSDGDSNPNFSDQNPLADTNSDIDTDVDAAAETKGECNSLERGNSEPPVNVQQCPIQLETSHDKKESSHAEKYALCGEKQQHAGELINTVPATANGTEQRGRVGHGPKAAIVQKKGRFSVTEGDVGSVANKPVVHPLPPLRRMHSLSSSQAFLSSSSSGLLLSPRVHSSSSGLPISPKVQSSSSGLLLSPKVQSPSSSSAQEMSFSSHTISVSAVLPQMQNILQSTLKQQDTVLHMLNNLGVGLDPTASDSSHMGYKSANARVSESELTHQITDLQKKVCVLQEEVHAIKAKNAQLEHRLSVIHLKEKERLKKAAAEVK